jgi:hypothetical protein
MTMAFAPDLTFNPDAHIEGRYMGSERQPLLVIDGVLKYPETLVRYAVEQSVFGAPSDRSNYPGINGSLPPDYGPALVQALRPLLHTGFGIPTQETLHCSGFFGLQTKASDALQPLQLIPHCDSQNPYKLAIIHYFCGAPYRGTAFFQHIPTGFESIDHRRYDRYRSTVEAEVAAAPTGETTALYRQIDHVEAVFNRLAVYRTTSLHSALMGGADYSADPATGRLTANSFIEVRPS